MSSKQCVDHLGNKFNSINEMCKYWGIDSSLYYSRIKSGLSIKEALTNPVGKTYKGLYGDTYTSLRTLAEAYNMKKSLLQYKLKAGYSLNKALREGMDTSKNITDHLGNRFVSISKMCEYWNISESAYNYRIKNGWSMKSALTTPVNIKCKECKDHLGNKFESVKAMCDYWEITHIVFNARMRLGWSLQKALTTKIGAEKLIKPCMDHLGNKFESVKAMCNYWGIDSCNYLTRIRRGWTLDKALTTPVTKRNSTKGNKHDL